MSERTSSRIPKLPFYAADLIVSAIACYVLYRLGAIDGMYEVIIAAICLAAAAWGAWLSVLPWLSEFRADAHRAETHDLTSVFDKLQNLEQVASRIEQSNANWQQVQDASSATVKAAREITEKMKSEAQDFIKFFETTNDQEKQHLRLELDKLKRTENDWLQVNVRILDHIFALHQAGLRSGQENLIHQLNQFQHTCRDIARRVGLMAYTPTVGEPFEDRSHQHADPNYFPPAGTAVTATLAPGYTFQGQLLRRALVKTAPVTSEPPDETFSQSTSSPEPSSALLPKKEDSQTD